MVLTDALRRVACLGGREGARRSLGSVHGGAVTRFLGSTFRRRRTHSIPTRVECDCNGMAVSVDGCSLFVAESDTVHKFSIVDDSPRRSVGGSGYGPCKFVGASQVWVAPDGFVFVAECHNRRVQVLTPRLSHRCFIDADGDLAAPVGVCANADVVLVSEELTCRVSVFCRADGTLATRFGRRGTGDGQLSAPHALCFMSRDRRVAVADWGNNRVSVFSVDGEFIRHVGVGVLVHPVGVAASAFDELVVADVGNRCLRLFGDGGDLIATLARGGFGSVVVRGSTVLAHNNDERCCVVFT